MEVATHGLKQPPGFRFLPTLEQAIECYLKPKVLGNRDDGVPDVMIPEVGMLAYEPWVLAAELRERWIMLTDNNQDEEWWFLYQQIEPRRGWVQRSTHSRSGYWNKTGDDLMITAGDSDRVIGCKKNAVFYKGRRPKGIKTNWVIHEHHATGLDDFFPMRKNLVLCSIKQNRDRKANITETKEQRDSVLEQNTGAVTSSRIMPTVEQESQVLIDSDYFPLDQVHRESMLADGEDDKAEEFISTVLIDSDEFGCDQMQMCGQTSSCASLDDPSAEAQVVEIDEQSGAAVSSQKRSMKKIGQDGVVPKTKKKSTCKDKKISPFYSFVYLRNGGIGIVLLIAIALRALLTTTARSLAGISVSFVAFGKCNGRAFDVPFNLDVSSLV